MENGRTYYAHTIDKGKETWQRLATHLDSVAQGACDRAAVFSAGEWGFWSGLTHDIGKYSLQFQNYLEHGGARVDHSTAGSRLVFETLEKTIGKAAASLISFVVAGHHAGLPNSGASIMDIGSLRERLQRTIPDYRVWAQEVTLPDPPSVPPHLRSAAPDEQGFALAFFTRMLFSCLTDADYQDTEAFCDPKRARLRATPPHPKTLLPLFETHMAALAEKTQQNSTISQWRQEILRHCIAAAQEKPGVFSLTVPTGGGKTLSSLAFALHHAKEHGLRRIIYVIPFTSIIDQNAAIFRAIMGDTTVLEHHSAYTFKEKGDFGPDEQALADQVATLRLATENWEATVIVTTAVQFFESLFACRSSQCRKLHNIAKSVVILDEAQMLPPNLLAPSVMALRELARGYGTSIVLCTATQPAVTESRALPSGFRHGDVREIIPENRLSLMFNALRRVNIVSIGICDDTHLAERLRMHEQILCIVNTRDHARTLFETLGKKEDGHFHLSALMYPAHRQEILKTIHERLHQGKRCRVISTSLIEAGVDIDFPVVYRAITGLDSIIQAAGRCNREGKSETPGEVFVFTPPEGVPKAPFFNRRAAATAWVLERHTDIASPQAIHAYFSQLYQGEKLDEKGILSDLKPLRKNDIPNIPFRKIANDYHLIADGMEGLIIERDEALALVATLEQTFDMVEVRKILRKLQLYTVQIYPYQMCLLEKAGNVRRIRDIFPVLSGGSNYSTAIGFVIDDPIYRDLEKNMF